MELKTIRHLWGVDERWEDAFPKFKAKGYAGIESPLPDETRLSSFQSLLRDFDFLYIPQIFTRGQTVEEHIESFKQQVDAVSALNPLFINAHSGRDAWSEAESHHFFAQVLEIEAQAGVPVAHETHRGRIFFNPWITSRLLTEFPALKVCCDLSHWVCVCERMLDTEEDIIIQTARHCIHLHARVGYEEGPQVPDPRAPEYGYHLDAHEHWWDIIWKTQQAQGTTFTTLTPEFGPPNYMHTLPFTNVPVTDLWGICDWMAERQQERFAKIAQGT
jgi:sugar phosphate isomerase/epimerase